MDEIRMNRHGAHAERPDATWVIDRSDLSLFGSESEGRHGPIVNRLASEESARLVVLLRTLEDWNLWPSDS